jgi:hypothetical protein
MASRHDGSGDRSTPHRHLPVGLRRGLFLVGLAATVVVAGLPAAADTPETGGDAGVTLTVTPSDNVSDGQTVIVTGTGFPPNASGLVRQCAGAVPDCDTFVASIFLTSPDGSIPPVYLNAQRVITTWTTTYNCSTQACSVVATAGGKSGRHHISIAGAGTVVPTSTTPSTIPTTSPTTTATTVTTVTTTPTTIPGTVTTTTAPPTGSNIICDILQALRGILGGLLAGVVDGLLSLFGCPPAPAG